MGTVNFTKSGPNGEMRCCAGSKQDNLFMSKKWYKKKGMGTEWTVCEYCYNHEVHDNSQLEEYTPYKYGSISCDTMPESYKDKWGVRILPANITKNGDFGISVHLTDCEYSYTRKSVEALLAKTHRHLAPKGTGVYEVPSGLGFRFKIYSFDECSNTYYTIEGWNGKGEKILVNNGNKIYYPGGNIVTIDNMESGTDRSFTMYVPSNLEKSSGGLPEMDPSRPENNWTWKYTKYRRVDTRPKQQEPCYLDGCRGGDGYRGGGGYGDCEDDMTTYNQGMVMSGGSYTPHTSTCDIPEHIKYTEEESFNITIQLVSSETQKQLVHVNKDFNTNLIEETELELSEQELSLSKLISKTEVLKKQIESNKEKMSLAKKRSELLDTQHKHTPTETVTTLEEQKDNLVRF